MGKFVPVTSFTSVTALTAAVPPVGTVSPGELLVDAQSRTMWLGVQPDIDPLQAILLSDMAALIQADADTLTAAKKYTDDRLKGLDANGIGPGYSELKHKHPSTDITDFEAKVLEILGKSSVSFKKQMIMMFSGDPTWIGNNTGPVDLTGWQLCDGSNGTPDLKDRFIIGHSATHPTTDPNKNHNTINPNALKQTGSAGKHAHGGNTYNTTLNTSHIPSHPHPYQDDLTYNGYPGHRHLIENFGSFIDVYTNPAGQGTKYSLLRNTGADVYTRASPVYITVLAQSSANNPHLHTIAEVADHSHSFPADTLEAIPYYALAFIMKL